MVNSSSHPSVLDKLLICRELWTEGQLLWRLETDDAFEAETNSTEQDSVLVGPYTVWSVPPRPSAIIMLLLLIDNALGSTSTLDATWLPIQEDNSSVMMFITMILLLMLIMGFVITRIALEFLAEWTRTNDVMVASKLEVTNELALLRTNLQGLEETLREGENKHRMIIKALKTSVVDEITELRENLGTYHDNFLIVSQQGLDRMRDVNDSIGKMQAEVRSSSAKITDNLNESTSELAQRVRQMLASASTLFTEKVDSATHSVHRDTTTNAWLMVAVFGAIGFLSIGAPVVGKFMDKLPKILKKNKRERKRAKAQRDFDGEDFFRPEGFFNMDDASGI